MYKKYIVLSLIALSLLLWPVSLQGEPAMNISSEALENSGKIVSAEHPTNAAANDPAIPESSIITLKNPTFQEAEAFMENDSTDSIPFVAGQYECRHFAADVVNHAEAAGLRCGFVMIGYDQSQHAAVAFDTTDRGIIYYEPQTDSIIQPAIGGTYQNKGIKEILIAW